MPSCILAKGIVGTSKHTYSCIILSISPRIWRANKYTSLCGIISICDLPWDVSIWQVYVVRALPNTRESKHISICIYISWAILNTSAGVIICKLIGKSCILHAGHSALSSHIISPCSKGAWLIVAAVAKSRIDWTRPHAGVGRVICKGIRKGRTYTYAAICWIICILSALTITVWNTAMKETVSKLHLRATINTKPWAVLWKEYSNTIINTSSLILIAKCIKDKACINRESSRASRHTRLSIIISEESSRAIDEALASRIRCIIEPSHITLYLTNSWWVIRVNSRASIIWTERYTYTSSSWDISIIFW